MLKKSKKMPEAQLQERPYFIHPRAWTAAEIACDKLIIHNITHLYRIMKKVEEYPRHAGTVEFSPWVAQGISSDEHFFLYLDHFCRYLRGYNNRFYYYDSFLETMYRIPCPYLEYASHFQDFYNRAFDNDEFPQAGKWFERLPDGGKLFNKDDRMKQCRLFIDAAYGKGETVTRRGHVYSKESYLAYYSDRMQDIGKKMRDE